MTLVEKGFSYGGSIAALIGLVGLAAVTVDRQDAHAEELEEISEGVEENAEDIEGIELFLRQRQGEVALDVQRIESQQLQLSKDFDELKEQNKEILDAVRSFQAN